jgi:hypothetical protein
MSGIFWEIEHEKENDDDDGRSLCCAYWMYRQNTAKHWKLYQWDWV